MAWRMRLKELLASGGFRTQGELVAALGELGIEVDQGTVSRELRAMGVGKVDGVYRLPPPAPLPATVYGAAFTAGDCLAVLKTDSAFASAIAQHVDAAGLDGVLGTVAGDDTVFVALSGPGAASELLELLGLAR